MSVSGDFAKLQGLIRSLSQIGSGRGWARISDEMGQETMHLIQEGFNSDTDPYGARWAPLTPWTRATGGSRILKRTQRMQKSWAMRTNGNGFSIENTESYTGVHQAGASYLYRGKRIRIPSRKMIPTEERGLGRWRSRLMKVAARSVFNMLRGR